MIGKSSGRWGLTGFVVAAALLAFGPPVQAQWSGSFVDMGVNYTLTDLTASSSATHTYSLVLDTTGYNHHASPAYLDSVDIKAWDGSSILSFALTGAPSGSSAWTGTNGPISSGPAGNTGCGSSSAGFACVEAITKGIFDVALGAPYSFLFAVTATSAAAFLTSADGAHVGAGYADSVGRGASYGITSVEMTTPIPEPETYAMLLAGLGLMAFVARRRRRNLVTA